VFSDGGFATPLKEGPGQGAALGTPPATHRGAAKPGKYMKMHPPPSLAGACPRQAGLPGHFEWGF